MSDIKLLTNVIWVYAMGKQWDSFDCINTGNFQEEIYYITVEPCYNEVLGDHFIGSNSLVVLICHICA